MMRYSALVVLLFIPLFASYGTCDEKKSIEPTLLVQGKIVNRSGNPVKGVIVKLYKNGKPFNPNTGENGGHKGLETGPNGLFGAEIMPAEINDINAKWSIDARKPGFKEIIGKQLPHPRFFGIDKESKRLYSTATKITMTRKIGLGYFTALAILILVYFLIATELVHRATAALAGASAILMITHTLGKWFPSFHILSFNNALRSVDWNVIFLLMGMMILVAILKECGIFQWMAYKAFKLSRGRVFVLSSVFCLITALASAFLDNVTTMLLFTPVSLNVAAALGIAPMALLLPQILASNFGGAATLIGDPPNIMIGSYAGLSFNDFVVNIGPVVIIVLILQILYSRWYYRSETNTKSEEQIDEMIASLRDKYQITNYRLLAITGCTLLGVMTLFVLHERLGMEVSVAALFGAALALILTGEDLPHILEHEVEWPSLVFFIMLFVVVAGAREVGILDTVARGIKIASQDDIRIAILVIVWTAGIASAIVDNIPFTATMLPVIASLSDSIPGAESGVLWWALALGACFGGNGSLVGASANVVTADIASKQGSKITFMEFAKYGTPMAILSLIVSSVYLLIVWT